MSKKRNCRRTDTERSTHEKAVAIRKMTDEQLVAALEERYVKGYEIGYKSGIDDREFSNRELSSEQMIERLSRIKGVGAATMAKIRDALTEV